MVVIKQYLWYLALPVFSLGAASKIPLFLDPPHGFKHGILSGMRTGRVSLNHFPEEKYAISLFHELYPLLKKNFVVYTYKDFQKAILKKSIHYKDRKFTEVVDKIYKIQSDIFLSNLDERGKRPARRSSAGCAKDCLSTSRPFPPNFHVNSAVLGETPRTADIFPVYFSLHLNNISPVQNLALRQGKRGAAIVRYKNKWYLTYTQKPFFGTEVLVSMNDRTGFSKKFCQTFANSLQKEGFPIRKPFCHQDTRYAPFFELPYALLVEAGNIASLQDLSWLSVKQKQKTWVALLYKSLQESSKYLLEKKKKGIFKQSLSNALFARQLRLKKLRLHSLLKQATENHVNTPLFFYAQFCKSFQKNYCPYPAHFTKYLKPYFGRSQIFKPYQNQCIKKWIFIKKETPQSIRQTLPKVLQGKSGLFRCVFGQWRRVTEIAIENPAKWQKKIQQQWILSPS